MHEVIKDKLYTLKILEEEVYVFEEGRKIFVCDYDVLQSLGNSIGYYFEKNNTFVVKHNIVNNCVIDQNVRYAMHLINNISK